MMRFFERIAWYRAERYLARYKPYGIAVAGTYGRELTARAIWHALHQHRHVRSGGRVEHMLDIPEGILGVKGHGEHARGMRMIVRSKMRELTRFEPDTIITQLPLVMSPHTAPWALSRILPRMLVLTNVGLERIDLFVAKGLIAREYLALANTLQRDAVVVLNMDDESLRNISTDINRSVITYGRHEKADVRIVRSQLADNGKGLFLEIVLHGSHLELYLPKLFADQHAHAVVAGIAVAHGLGIPMDSTSHSLRIMKPLRGFLARTAGIHGSIVIDDSVNTCPEQLENSLQTFASIACAGRKMIVVGDMDNLASLTKELHENVGKQVSVITPIAIFVGENMRHAQKSATLSGSNIDTHHFATSTEAAAWLPEHVRENDMIFVSGGKSMEMGKVVKKLKGK